MQFVVFYSSDPSALPGLQAAYPRHVEYMQAFAAEGGLIGIGTFNNPGVNGSMGIFTSKERAEQFIAGDPFVLEGLAVPGEIREWNAVMFSPQDPPDVRSIRATHPRGLHECRHLRLDSPRYPV